MRLWSLHPVLLDSKGIVAVWREALLAQAVLSGRTTGYRNHPQLIRFRSCSNSLSAIATYLQGIHREATLRGYRFDEKRILHKAFDHKLPVSQGQLRFEMKHLRSKLRTRDRTAYARLRTFKNIPAHPLFRIVPGDIEEWEVTRS